MMEEGLIVRWGEAKPRLALRNEEVQEKISSLLLGKQTFKIKSTNNAD